jgi:DNA-binding NarL/FixJ family response regulator
MIRVLVVHPIRLVGHALAALVDQEPDMVVAGRTTSVDGALAVNPPADVILVDISMTDGAALRLIRSIVEAKLPSQVLAVRPAALREAGAAGYVLADNSVEALVSQIRGACREQVQAWPTLAEGLTAPANTARP